MDFSFFTGLNTKSTRVTLEEECDLKTFLENLKRLINVKSEGDFDQKLKRIFADKKQCSLFCKKLGLTTEDFIVKLVKCNVGFMYEARNINMIKRIHFSENE
jgi:hypothetical protein